MTRRPQASPSTYDATGYPNRWGGFHTDSTGQAVWRLARLTVRYPYAWRFALHLWRNLIVHRGCDTTDFHHSIYCTLDPFGKKLHDNHRWHMVLGSLAARRRCRRCRVFYDLLNDWTVYDPKTKLSTRGWCPDCGRRENAKLSHP
ncbi:MAG: hypothetical protein NVS3B1_05970 [Marmoricola sp.]